MDPITTAVVAAIAGGVMKEAVASAYKALVGALTSRFGGDSKVVDAVRGVEASPESKARPEVLHEEVVAAGADRDADVLAAAQRLLAALQQDPDGRRHVAVVTGNFSPVAQGGSHASVNIDFGVDRRDK